MSRRIASSYVILFILCAQFLGSAASGAPSYTITDLGVLPGGAGQGWSAGYGLNDAGVVVGSAGTQPPSPVYHAVVWRDGHLVDVDAVSDISSSAAAVNNANRIVGTSLGDSFGTYRAMLWIGRHRFALGSLPGTPTSEAEDINDANQIVGSVIYTYDHYQAFLWQNGTMMGLGTLGGRSSAAYGINSAGAVVGGADTTTVQQHAFVWRNGRMTDLGTPAGWSWALAIAISDNGRIVGSGDNASHQTRGFSYLNGVWTEIGPIGSDTTSAAEDVNSAGYVVGFSTNSYLAVEQLSPSNRSQDHISASDHAWLYAGGTLYDLQTLIPPGSGWQLVRADAINENGQITGAGWSPGGSQHGFLLTPTS